jgi:cellulose synthase/poly-beta-1,6-N-acetylglucosamine synthase-like glycosyltransferase
VLVFSAICIVLCLLYVLLMGLYLWGWHAKQDFREMPGYQPQTRISVIIPARNEAENIGACVASVLGGDYPRELLQVIVVDDFSEDGTAGFAAIAGAEVLRMDTLPADPEGSRAFKKKALAAGIATSSGELIVTTDADCIAPKGWLRVIAAVYERAEAAAVIGPVAFHDGSRIVEMFQSIDFTTMQGITAAAHQLGLGNMANGANFAFARDAYEAVGGYRDISGLASGDDYLLLHKLKQRYPQGIRYLKSRDAIIRTAAQPDWRSFFRQRIRWASKSGKYPDHRLTAILTLVYLFNVALTGAALAAAFGAFPWMLCGALFFFKVIAELIFLWPVSGFYGKRGELIRFPFLQPLHILYIVSAGFMGMARSYEWKGRQVR